MNRIISDVKHFFNSNGIEYTTIYSNGSGIERSEAYQIITTRFGLRCTVGIAPFFLEFVLHLPVENGPQVFELVNTLNTVSLGTVCTMDGEIILKYTLLNFISELKYDDVDTGFRLMLADSEEIISRISK
ncbi:TPA: hypothetical protein ACLBAX_000042 [Streptococcus suis]